MSAAEQSTKAPATEAPSVNDSVQTNPEPKVANLEKLKEMRDDVIAKYERTQANLERNTKAKGETTNSQISS